MNPPSSSSSRIGKKCSPAPEILDSDPKRRKKPTTTRNPLKDINSGSTASSSSSISGEAPRGCLGFFLSNNSSSSHCSRINVHNRSKPTLNKTPKSAPNARASRPSRSKENLPDPTSQVVVKKSKKSSPFLYQWQSERMNSSSRSSQKTNPCPVFGKDSEGFPCRQKLQKQKQKQHLQLKIRDDVCETPEVGFSRFEAGRVSDRTPVSRLVCGSTLNSNLDKTIEEDLTTKDAKTPPIEASVSPEIQQCVSFVSSTTPACYGAGHLVSGISDKRKCRPRGILTVGDNDLSFDESGSSDNGSQEYDHSRVSPVPSPAEASMRWLLSPCNEEDEDQNNNPSDKMGIENLFPVSALHPPETGLSPSELPEFQGFLGPLCCSSTPSPHSSPNCKAIISQGKRKHQFSLARESSPKSLDSLGSENVVQTPPSDSSSGRRAGPSWVNVDDNLRSRFETELDSVAEILERTSLSSQSQLSMQDSMGLSFQFTHAATLSNSMDLARFHKTGDHEACWVSNHVLDNVSQPQMRISWREGLASQIFEMDEMDVCRCLSDEEEDVDARYNNQFECHRSPEPKLDTEDGQVLVNKLGSPKLDDNEQRHNINHEEKFPSHRDSACAESICTDGGSLIASGDSDWTLCYKNRLFEV